MQRWLEQVTPLVRLLSGGGIALSLALAEGVLSIGLGLVAGGLVWGLLSPRAWGRLLVLLALMLMFGWSIILSPEGRWETALLVVGRVLAIAIWLQALLGTLSGSELAQALQRLRLPHKLVTMLVLMVRYIHTLEAEYQRLWRGMRARGFVLSWRPRALRGFGMLLAMLLWRSLLRAEQVDRAMRCRGFRGRFPVFHSVRGGRLNSFAIAIAVVWMLGIFWLEMYQ